MAMAQCEAHIQLETRTGKCAVELLTWVSPQTSHKNCRTNPAQEQTWRTHRAKTDGWKIPFGHGFNKIAG